MENDKIEIKFKDEYYSIYVKIKEINDYVGIHHENYLQIFNSIDKYNLINFKCELTLFLCLPVAKKILSEKESHDVIREQYSDRKDLIFRGQNNFKFNLCPSIMRGINKRPLLIDFDFIQKKYEETNIYKKYIDIFPDGKFDYRFLSFTQHSLSYSQFLDFTKNIDVAFIFATQDESVNNWIDSDFTIYVLDINDNNSKLDKKFESEKYKIQYFPNKISPVSKIFGKLFWQCELDDLVPEMDIFKSQNNDRMLYQQGVFLYFYKGIIVNNMMLFPYSSTKLTKIDFNSKEKGKIYYDITKEKPQLSFGNLMDPYKYLHNLNVGKYEGNPPKK